MESWEKLVFELNICPNCYNRGDYVKLEPNGKNCWLCRTCGELYGICPGEFAIGK